MTYLEKKIKIYLDESLFDLDEHSLLSELFLDSTGFSPCQVLYSKEFLNSFSLPHFLHFPKLVGPLGGSITQ